MLMTVDMETTAKLTMSGSSTQRTLLLAPPSISTKEDKLQEVFRTFDRRTTDLQMLDRLSAGFVFLPSNAYDYILVLTDTDGGAPSKPLRLLNRNVYTALVPSMKAGAKLRVQGGSFDIAEAQEAVLAGLVEEDGVFKKLHDDERVAVPLRLGVKKVSARAKKDTSIHDLDNALDGDDELIDEDTLLSEEDLKRPQQPPECQPKPGRRRRACKDCTCGLAAQIEAEDKARQMEAGTALNILKLQSDDLNELDFTVQGKTGSCGNCALGDAFRCTGCPFIGLPSFQPGQEVQILNDVVQL